MYWAGNNGFCRKLTNINGPPKTYWCCCMSWQNEILVSSSMFSCFLKSRCSFSGSWEMYIVRRGERPANFWDNLWLWNMLSTSRKIANIYCPMHGTCGNSEGPGKSGLGGSGQKWLKILGQEMGRSESYVFGNGEDGSCIWLANSCRGVLRRFSLRQKCISASGILEMRYRYSVALMCITGSGRYYSCCIPFKSGRKK